MKFFADAMLGKLARWLRILGYDTAYQSDIEDGELVQRARAEGRLILTRDTRLIAKLSTGEFLFINDNATIEQLRQTVDTLGLCVGGAGFLTRCVVCNAALVRTDRDAVRGAVPEYTFHATKSFLGCPGCGRTYWEGTHTGRIKARLDAAGIGGRRLKDAG
jgi:uncharacterized protein